MIATYNVLNDLNNLFDAFIEPHFTTKSEIQYVQYKVEGDTIELRYLVPGAKTQDIDVNLENDVIKVSFANKTKEDKEHNYLRRERHMGTFTKALKLPFRVDQDSVKAELKDGVLTLMLEKAAEAKPKKIAVH